MVSVLLDYYVCLSMEPFQCEVAATVARKCCLLYSALSKMAADREQPWVVPMLFVNSWMVWSLSVQRVAVGREYHGWLSVCRYIQPARSDL